jgi:3-methyladenine DNA glycosylase AlkD
MHSEIKILHSVFLVNKNPEKAAAMAAYMKNHFPFFGLQKKERSALQKDFLVRCSNLPQEEVHLLVRELWQLPEREFHYTALEMLYKTRKKWTGTSLELFEFLVLHNSWWDSVDFIASRMIGGYCQKDHQNHHQRLLAYARNEQHWLKRTAIIHQLFYREKTDTRLFEQIFYLTNGEKDFFIQKAIGWALRQYSYTNAEFVKKFVAEKALKGLAQREALKGIVRTSLK